MLSATIIPSKLAGYAKALKQKLFSFSYPSVNNDRFGKIRSMNHSMSNCLISLLFPFFRASAIGDLSKLYGGNS
jgi:hypothetical protein